MKKKATALIEVALLLCFVACVSIVIMNIFNTQKENMVKMSNVKVRE